MLDLSPLADRWRAFGWDVHEVDGHDIDALGQHSMRRLDDDRPAARAVAATMFGKGVSVHGAPDQVALLPMSDERVAQALQAVAEVLA